mgnify:CR=1 FL=1
MLRRNLLALLPAPLLAAARWKRLFNGKDLGGWTATAGDWKVAGGAIVCESGESGWLRAAGTYADFILELEFRTAPDGNSGVFIRAAEQGRPWETGYEVQIYDTHPTHPTGSLVGAIVAKGGKLTGAWQKMVITARGNAFEVAIDGQRVAQGTDAKSARGYVALQYNKGKKIAFRRLRIREL